MSRVTDFRIDHAEMDVRVYWSLPQSVRDLIHTYSEKVRTENGKVKFELAIYRWEEIQQELEKLIEGDLVKRDPNDPYG